jgi:hypothetical protein
MKTIANKKILLGLVLGFLCLSGIAMAGAQEPFDMPPGGPNPDSALQEGPPNPPPDMVKKLRSSLDTLAMKGTLDQDQVQRVMSFFKQKDAERKAEWEKIKSMSREDRDAYMQTQCQLRCQNRPDIVKDLIEGAGLTTEQAKAVAMEMRPPHDPGRGPGPGPR